jgi:magnesium transporter
MENAESLPATEALRESWVGLTPHERQEAFAKLAREDAEEFFLSLSAHDQAEILHWVSPQLKRSWVRLLALDDAVDLIQELEDAEEREQILALFDVQARREVTALLAYSEDDAGGLMNPEFVRLRPDMQVDAAILYLRAQIKEHAETIYYGYVLDSQQKLLGVVSFRELFSAAPSKLVREVMHTDLVTIPAEMDQEEVSQRFSTFDLMAMPVINAEGRMVGVVTFDDIVDVVREEATEDIQKFGGMEVLDAPYFSIGFFEMVRKRAGWLTILFIGEMFTATAMGHYGDELSRAVVLALFIPLIISSGGNSGSQASTLIIRAMALGEVRLRDWWRIFFREILTGLFLGSLLGVIGLCRILIWPQRDQLYGEHYFLIGITIFTSLIGVVTFGTLAGSMLPFILRSCRLDPASASAPFVATLVDVTGLIIYFTTANLILRGVLL